MSLSITAANVSLDSFYGDDASSLAPASFSVRLYAGNPLGDGVELTGVDSPGYAPLTGVTNNSTNFPAADGGSKTSAVFEVCTATDTWDAAPTHAALCDGSTVLEVVELLAADVPAAGGTVTAQFVLFYNQIGD